MCLSDKTPRGNKCDFSLPLFYYYSLHHGGGGEVCVVVMLHHMGGGLESECCIYPSSGKCHHMQMSYGTNVFFASGRSLDSASLEKTINPHAINSNTSPTNRPHHHVLPPSLLYPSMTRMHLLLLFFRPGPFPLPLHILRQTVLPSPNASAHIIIVAAMGAKTIPAALHRLHSQSAV